MPRAGSPPIGNGHHGDRGASPPLAPAWLLLVAIRAPATAGTALRDGQTRTAAPATAAGAAPTSGRQGPGDRGEELAGSGGAADAAGSTNLGRTA